MPAGCWWKRPGISRAPYRPSRDLRRRWDLACTAARELGYTANHHLHHRWVCFDQRKKRAVVANTAMARELASWCWALAVRT